MKNQLFAPSRLLPCLTLAATVVWCGGSTQARAGERVFTAALSGVAETTAQDKDKEKDKGPKVSDGEAKAAQKIKDAPDAAAKLKAAEEFIKKYPKSTLRPQVLGFVAGQIAETPDAAQKITLAESFMAQFKEPGEGSIITSTLIEAYAAASRFDDAFRLGETHLAATPDDVYALTKLALDGIDQAKRNNPKFVEPAQRYAVKAIELIEGGKKPAAMSEESWGVYKTRHLPALYQSLGYVALASNRHAEALPRLQKAAELNKLDPITFFLIGNIKDAEYEAVAKQFQSLSVESAKQEMLPIVHAKMDAVMEMYARVVALTADNAQYKQLHDEARKSLEAYYKFRYKSADGLQAYIDKNKPTP